MQDRVKLRIHGNSLRFRLSRSDVKQLRENGTLIESLCFGSGAQLTYTLETSSESETIDVQYRDNRIRVLLPLSRANQWATTDEISLSLDSTGGSGPSLLIEKDFQCLHHGEASQSDDTDSFANPAAADASAIRMD